MALPAQRAPARLRWKSDMTDSPPATADTLRDVLLVVPDLDTQGAFALVGAVFSEDVSIERSRE